MINIELAKSLGSPVGVLSQKRRSEFQRIFSMTRFQERESLYAAVRYAYTGEGAIWDIGCAAGGSSYFLGAGLQDRSDTVAENTIKCFDIFNGGSRQLLKDFFPEEKDDLGIFRMNTLGVGELLTPVKLDLRTDFGSYSTDRKVEIAHIDAAKSLDLWKAIFATISVNIIPGKTIWVFQDFERARLPWQVYSLWELLEFGEIMGGATYGTIYFKFLSQPTEEKRRKILSDDFSIDVRLNNIRRFYHLIRRKYRSFFPDEIFRLEDVEAATLAYCHYWNNDVSQAQAIFSGISAAYRSEDSNKIYSRDIFGSSGG